MTQILMRKVMGALRPADSQAQDEMAKLTPGQDYRIEVKRMRNPRQHRLYWALIRTVYEHQSRYATQEQLHNALKVAAGYCDELEGRNGTVYIPKSISFGNMSQDAFEEFFSSVVRIVTEKVMPHTSDEELRRELESMIGAQ